MSVPEQANLSFYWLSPRIGAYEQYWLIYKEIPECRTVIEQLLSEGVAHFEVQQKLFLIYQTGKPESKALAERCLLNSIAMTIVLIATELIRKFGKSLGIELRDILPSLLGGRELIARQILQRYQPNRGCSLSSYAKMCVKSNDRLRAFNLHFTSDVKLLLAIKPKDIEEILAVYHGWTASEMRLYTALLEAFQFVYLTDLLDDQE